MIEKTPPAPRFSAKLRDALDLLVHHGRKPADACKEAGLHPDSLRKALKRPDVLAYLNGEYEVVRTQARARTIFRAEDLADSAQSEHVRLQANEWLAAIDGVSPVSKGEMLHLHNHNHRILPGLIIVRRGYDEPQGPILQNGHVIEQPRRRRPINVIGTPRPHPSMIKAEGE